MSHGYHNDDLDNIGYDVKGRPDANPLGFVVLVLICVFVLSLFFGHDNSQHKHPQEKTAVVTAAQLNKIQHQLSDVQREVQDLKEQTQ